MFFLCYTVGMEISKYFTKKSEYSIILGLLFLVPLIFDAQVFSSFALPKTIVFDLLFFCLLLAWFGRLSFSRKFAWPRNKYFNLLFATFAGAEILSVVFSSAPIQSWSGSALRLSGTFQSLQLLVIFLWLVLNFDFVKSKISWLINAVTLSGVAASLYGLAQVAGYDPLKWQVFEGVLVRASSTLGQPNYLGSFLLGALALAGLGYALAQKNSGKLFFAFAILIESSALLYSLSRSAWLGLLGACSVYLLIYLYGQRRRYFWAASSLIVIMLAVWLSLGFSGRISAVEMSGQSELKKRVVSVLDFREGSIRGYYYASAVDLIKKQPIFGYGRDMAGYYFYPYYAPNWSIYEVINQATDRAHNFWLDLWLQVGILGVLTWLGLLYFIIRIVSTSQQSKTITVFSFLGFLAIFLSWQFGFATIEPALLLWLFAGLIIGELDLEKREIKIKASWLALVGAVFLFVSLSAMSGDFQRYQASRSFRQLLTVNDATENVGQVKDILNLATASDLKSFYAVNLYSLVAGKIKIENLEKGELEYLVNNLEELDFRPFNFEYRIGRLIFLSEMSKDAFRRGGGSALAQSLEAEYAKLQGEAPGYAVVELGWGNLLFYQNKYAQALTHYQKALRLYPDLGDPRINAEHRGMIEQERNQVLRGLTACEQALKNEILESSKLQQ